MTEDEMVEWHHQLDGHDFEQAAGDSEGQGSLACCSPRGLKESDITEQLNNNKSQPQVCFPCLTHPSPWKPQERPSHWLCLLTDPGACPGGPVCRGTSPCCSVAKHHSW